MRTRARVRACRRLGRRLGGVGRLLVGGGRREQAKRPALARSLSVCGCGCQCASAAAYVCLRACTRACVLVTFRERRARWAGSSASRSFVWALSKCVLDPTEAFAPACDAASTLPLPLTPLTLSR
eukprot:6206654-Pleurochrysis_carterae.AAC.1